MLILISINIFSLNEYEKKILKLWPDLKYINPISGGPTVFYNEDNLILNIIENKKEYNVQIGKIKISPDSLEFLITCSSGRSHDPEILFETKINNKVINDRIYSYYIVIPGDGFIYTIKSGIGYFIDYRKYYFRKDKFVEIIQPLQFIGKESKALADFGLYMEKEEENLIVQIEKKETIFIIGGVYNEKSNNVYFLIKNQFGITGWHKLIIFDVHNTSIEGIIGSPD